MSRYVEYQEPDSKVTEEQALQDCREYLGDEKFDEMMEALQHDQTLKSEQQVRFCFGALVGISGYPVTVMLRRYRPDLLKAEDRAAHLKVVK